MAGVKAKLKIKRMDTGRYRYSYTGKDGSKIKGQIELPPAVEGTVALTPQQEERAARRKLEALTDGLNDALWERAHAKMAKGEKRI